MYCEEAELGIVEVLRKELEDGGIKDLSRRMLYEYIRLKYNIVSRDRLYRVLDALNPEAVRRRRVKAKQHRGTTVIPRPNYV